MTLTKAELIVASRAMEGPMEKRTSASGVATGIAICLLIGVGYLIWKAYF